MSNVSKNKVRKEFGPDVIHGLPVGKTITMDGTLFDDVIFIWEEVALPKKQVLTVEDVIEELERIPERFRKVITCIILSPCSDPEDPTRFAVTHHYKTRGQITIYKSNLLREEMKYRLLRKDMIMHEIGHIFDFQTPKTDSLLSESEEWTNAIDEDTRWKSHGFEPLAPIYVSDYARAMQSLTEDFAESFKMFYNPRTNDKFIKCFPRRAKFIERVFEL